MTSRDESSRSSSVFASSGSTARREVRIAVVGSAQVFPVSACIQALVGGEAPRTLWATPPMVSGGGSASDELAMLFATHDKVLIQPALWRVVSTRHAAQADKAVLYPELGFRAYHPDLVYIGTRGGGLFDGPLRHYNSWLALLGWKAGLSAARTVDLFRHDVFAALGYFDEWNPSVAALVEEGQAAGLHLDDLIVRWHQRGCFMHAINSPKVFAVADVVRQVLGRMGIRVAAGHEPVEVRDHLATQILWPVYPEVARHLGLSGGDYRFRLETADFSENGPATSFELGEFVVRCFELFSAHGKDDLVSERGEDANRLALITDMSKKRKSSSSPAVQAVEAALATDGGVLEGISLPPAEVSDPIPLGGVRGSHKFAVLGNCQTGQLARCLQAYAGGELPTRKWVTHPMIDEWNRGEGDFEEYFRNHDKVFIQPWIWEPLSARYAHLRGQVVLYPSIAFIAYQPDLLPLIVKETGLAFDEGPLQRCNSSLAFIGWKEGMTVQETAALFRREVFEKLNFFELWDASVTVLKAEGEKAEFPLDELIPQWAARGCFMYCHMHPKLFVLADIARLLLLRLGVPVRGGDPTQYISDILAAGVSWPVYPEMGDVLGCEGVYAFKEPTPQFALDGPVNVYGLEEFLEVSFKSFSDFKGGEITSPRNELPHYKAFLAELRAEREAARVAAAKKAKKAAKSGAASKPAGPVKGGHPYRGLPPHRFWKRAIEETPASAVDPALGPAFRIDPHTAVATAGSCFAQHIANRLSGRGFNFLRTEKPPAGMSAEEGQRRNYELFPARFGNVYTARQLLQLMERAYGEFEPVDRAWAHEGRYVDPFRPQIEPDGFASVEALEADRKRHLAAVREMFETLNVFVFTLGLTEAWRSREDGAVFPIAPGVAGGTMDPERYEFVNYSLAQIDADLESFVARLARINPRARLIFTVSPVPLAATYEDRHVLTATTYSKSVLRVAAEQITRRHAHCEYFPSYEVITGSFNRGAYFDADLRSVRTEGVDHVMRLFFAHYTGDTAPAAANPAAAPSAGVPSPGSSALDEARRASRTLCDEELLAAAAR